LRIQIPEAATLLVADEYWVRNKAAWTVVFETPAESSELRAFYSRTLSEVGFDVQITSPSPVTMDFESTDVLGTVTILGTSTGSEVTIIVSSP